MKEFTISLEWCDVPNKGDLSANKNGNKGDLSADIPVNANEPNKGDLSANKNGNKGDFNKSRSAKPKSLAEVDPLLNAFKENSPEEVQDLLNDDKQQKKGTSLITEDKLQTNDGEIQIKKYGIKRRQQVKNLKCPVDSCTDVFDFVRQMNAHIKDTHPDFRFKCQYCTKSYMTYNARYKHEHSHFKLPYACHYCEK